MSVLETTFAEAQHRSAENQAKEIFQQLIQKDHYYVGKVYPLGYEAALVQIHDSHRSKVGGIPSLCFLIATRVSSEKDTDGSSVIAGAATISCSLGA